MSADRSVADRFAAACVGATARLPLGLATVVAPSLLGFAVINGFTFTVDLVVLTLAHGVAGLPVPASVTIGYAVALSLSYTLNRVLNFRSHAPLRPETGRYAAAVAVNFGVVLLGVTTGLTWLGVPYQAARLAAGACEGVFMYCAMRWFVFGREARRPSPARHDAGCAGAHQ